MPYGRVGEVDGTESLPRYGTSGGKIPEGYIDVTLPDGRQQNILHPATFGRTLIPDGFLSTLVTFV